MTPYYQDSWVTIYHANSISCKAMKKGYGPSPSNLANLKEGASRRMERAGFINRRDHGFLRGKANTQSAAYGKKKPIGEKNRCSNSFLKR